MEGMGGSKGVAGGEEGLQEGGPLEDAAEQVDGGLSREDKAAEWLAGVGIQCGGRESGEGEAPLEGDGGSPHVRQSCPRLCFYDV